MSLLFSSNRQTFSERIQRPIPPVVLIVGTNTDPDLSPSTMKRGQGRCSKWFYGLGFRKGVRDL